jgi:transposase-like protein
VNVKAFANFPDDLLEEAEQEPNHLDLDEYWQVIAKLREKGLTFREVAEWLAERNVHADHNAIYRVYTKHLSPDQAEAEERERDGARLMKEI